MSAGTVFGGINPFSLDAYDSSTTTYIPIRTNGATFIEDTPRNTIDYAHYDNQDGTLGNVGTAKYGVFWIYKHIDDNDVYVRYGVDSYSLAEAEVTKEPSKPDHLTDFGCLIGRIIVPYDGGEFTEVDMVTDRFFVGTKIGDHAALGNLQGGTTDEYYHLTSAEHTKAQNALNNVVEDTTPQLGGDLDVVTHKIVTTDNRNIVLEPNGTGIVKGETHYLMVRILDKDTAHTVANGVGGEYRIPRAITVKDVGAYVDTAGTTGVATIDINEAGTTILSTKITLDTGEKTSETAATPAVISDSAIAADAIITFDIDGIHTTAAKGLIVWLEFIYA